MLIRLIRNPAVFRTFFSCPVKLRDSEVWLYSTPGRDCELLSMHFCVQSPWLALGQADDMRIALAQSNGEESWPREVRNVTDFVRCRANKGVAAAHLDQPLGRLERLPLVGRVNALLGQVQVQRLRFVVAEDDLLRFLAEQLRPVMAAFVPHRLEKRIVIVLRSPIRSEITTSDSEIGRPRSGSPIC